MTAIPEEDFWSAAVDAFADDTLELTLLPTEQCNLRCTYCYETFELGKMDDGVVSSVRQLMATRSPGLRKLVIDWFGGEPLLAIDVIEQISGDAQRMADANPLLDYQSSITTNGVFLTAENARTLADVGVRRLHVSLDGPGEVHDQTRKLRGGQGTYARIERNLREIRDTPDIDVQIDLRVHVTPANHRTLDDFTEHLIETFLGDERFTVYYFPIVDLGGPNQSTFDILGPREAAAIVRRLTARVAEVQALRKAKVKGCDSAYVCYAAKPNAWVIRSDGSVGRCTVGLDDPQNQLGKLLPDGTLDVDIDLVRPWLRGWTDGDALSLHCPYEEMRHDVQTGLVITRR